MKSKKPIIHIYLLVVLFFSINNLFAKDSMITTSVSYIGMSMDYREYDNSGEILDSEESSYLELTGVEIGFEYSLAKGMSSSSEVKFNFMLLGGKTKYIGSYIGSGLGYGSVISSTQNSIIDTGITYKRSHTFKNSIEFNYGIGIGYREWERALSASQIEVYSWYSLRPMIGVNSDIMDGVNIGLTIEYQYGFETMMSASDLNYNFTLGGADIIEISLPISYNYNENIDFLFEAIFQKQTIEESNRLYSSDGSSYYLEPDSTAFNSYLKFGVEYHF